jgi:hypothetical protein
MSRTWKYYRDLDSLGDWAVENEMKVNANNSKAISFTRARKKDPLKYSLRDKIIHKVNLQIFGNHHKLG